METTEEENIHNALNKALTEFSEKLKEEYRLHGFKTKEFFEVIDKIMGNFYSPQDERARSRKVDSTSKNVRYNASKPISNKRGGSFEDAHVQKDKGCVKK